MTHDDNAFIGFVTELCVDLILLTKDLFLSQG